MLYALGELEPQTAGKDYWTAPTAAVIGDVVLGKNVSVWWGAVLRGDNDRITIGDNSNIQDGSTLHVDPGFPLSIGRDVTIGHMVMLHGCTIGDGSLIGIGAIILNGVTVGRNCLIGMGSVILDGAVVREGAMVGAGSLVSPGKEIEGGYLWLGSPARRARELTEKEKAFLQYSSSHYVDLKNRHMK